MKLKKLNIESYRHLHNIKFDFTYPKGHKQEGKPLEKICFIGQSATGKTSIIELIKNNISLLNKIEILNGEFFWGYFRLDFDGELEYVYNNDSLKLATETVSLNNHNYKNLPTGSGGGSVGKLIDNDLKLLYLSTELIAKETINIFNQNPLNIINELSSEKYIGIQKEYDSSNYIYEFIQEVNEKIWFSLLYEVLDYRKKFLQMASELINKGAIGDLNKLNKQYKIWSETNINPLVSFADVINPILKKLNLEVDLVNTEYPIPIKSLVKDEVIPISALSTGTKGLLLSMFPLYELDTSNSIILMDEPERSLFPDIQVNLMKYYTELAPTSQFIIATHSPFIAAAFEPEERFILYFNEEGEVKVRRGISPVGDDPNDILSNDFLVDYTNEHGKQQYRKYLDLKAKVREETEPIKKKELLLELTELGDKYNY